MEQWRDVLGFEGYYQVSDLGNVRSVDRIILDSNGKRFTKHGKVLRAANNGSGYRFVALCKQSKYTQRLVHRLVATAFLANPENKETVNHIDGDTQNNHASNLEWATQAENNEHALATGLRKREWTEEARQRVSAASKAREGKPVRCITTGQVFGSMRDAEKALKIGSSTVSTSIYEKRSTSGYAFEFVNAHDAIRQPRSKIDGRTQRRTVRCINDGTVYPSMAAAARAYELQYGQVVDSICKHKSVNGYQFVDADSL